MTDDYTLVLSAGWLGLQEFTERLVAQGSVELQPERIDTEQAGLPVDRLAFEQWPTVKGYYRAATGDCDLMQTWRAPFVRTPLPGYGLREVRQS